MRKETLKRIVKECKKGNLIGVTFEPTLEECDYLLSKGITATKSISKRQGLMVDWTYLVDTTDFIVIND